MTDFPSADYMTDAARTEAEFKVALDNFLASVKELPGGAAVSELTIASGSVVPTHFTHTLDTESDAAADDLTNADLTNMPDGRLLLLQAENVARVVTIKHLSGGSGQFSLADGLDAKLDTAAKAIIFQRRGSTLVEVFRSYQVASTAKAQAGTDNTDVISPLRMREGFNASGTAPVYACRAWVSFTGTGTVAVRGSGNVSSITDNGTGDYTVNFATAMEDANYSVGGSVSWNTASWGNTFAVNASTYSTTAVRFTSATGTGGTANDALIANLQVFR